MALTLTTSGSLNTTVDNYAFSILSNTSSVQLGAVSLKLVVPGGCTIKNVNAGTSSVDSLVFLQQDGNLNIGMYTLSNWVVNTDDVILSITASGMSTGSFTLNTDEDFYCEIASSSAEPFTDFAIKMPSLASPYASVSTTLEAVSILSGVNPSITAVGAPNSSVFGSGSRTSGTASIAEGIGTLASGLASHAAGINTTASGQAAFSMGIETDADGMASFAAGSGSWARGTATVAFGIGTIASSSGQLAVGHYNESKTDINNIFVVGDGTGPLSANRRNIIEVYGGQGALFRGVKIDTAATPTITTTIDGFNVYGRTIFYGGVTQSANIITIDGDYGGITHGSASYIAETYTSLGQLRGRTLFNYKGIDFNNSVQTTAPSSTHLWTNSSNRLFYSSSAVILNDGNTLGSAMTIGTTDVNNLQLETNNTTRVFISSSGNVGIGTTTPTNTLQVNGGVTATSFTGSLFGTSSWATNALTASNITPSITNNTDNRVLTATGGGTINGESNLTFDGSVLTVTGRANISTSITSSTATVGFGLTSALNAGQTTIRGSGVDTVGALTIQNSGGTATFTVLNGGTTGVGENNPSARLHVKGSGATSATTAMRIEDSGGNARLTILDDGTSAFNTSHLYISSSGNVGIGLTSPLAKLHISGANALRMQNTGFDTFEWFFSAGTGIGFRNVTDGTTPFFVGGTDDIGIGTTNTSARLHISGASNSNLLRVGSPTDSNILFITGSGRVGIGTSNPLSQLHITASRSNELLRITSGSQNILNIRSGSAVFFAGTGVAPTVGYDLDVQGTGTVNGGSVRIAGNSTVWNFASTSAVSRAATGNQEMFNVSMTGTSTALIQNPMSVTFNASQNATSGSGYIVLRLNATHATTAGTGSKLLQSWEFGGVRQSIIDLSGSLGIGTGSAPPARLFISGASNQALFEIDSPAVNNIIYVSGSGNVGIGTATPGVTLDVVGQIRASTTMFNSTTQTNTIQLSSATNLQFRSASIETARYDNNGWGFFNTTPTAKVHISGANADNLFRISSPSATNTLFVSGSGNVGIGTNLPSADLHISGASADSLLRVGSPTDSNILFITGSGRVGVGTSTPDSKLHISSNGGYQLRVAASASFSSSLMVSGSFGYVGIGVESPQSILHVNDRPEFNNVTGNVPVAFIGNYQNITTFYNNNSQDSTVLGEPAAWMNIKCDGAEYLIPLYTS